MIMKKKKKKSRKNRYILYTRTDRGLGNLLFLLFMTVNFFFVNCDYFPTFFSSLEPSFFTNGKFYIYESFLQVLAGSVCSDHNNDLRYL